MAKPVLEQLNDALAGTYTIERELGGGGMSRVFVATEIALGRSVVIKVLPPDIGVSLSVERFRQETRLTANLQHPHIVPVLAAGSAGELLYYTMPFVQGESLRDRLKRDTRLPIRETVAIVRDVLSALAYAHGQGVVHRDIKPDNILLTPHGALVTDFGIAKATLSAGPARHIDAPDALTGTGVSLGTMNYMAPEQLAADPTADLRVDIFAVGLVLYECLTGSLPFAELSPQLRLAAVMTQTPTRVQQVRKDVPARLAAIVDQCLMREREQRPASANAVLAAMAVRGPGRAGSWRGAVIGAAVAVTVLVAAGWAANGPLRVPLATARRIVARPDATLHTDRILVAPFEATPDDPSMRALGGMIADYVAQSLAVVPRVEVVDSRTAMVNAEIVDRIPRFLRESDRALAIAQETGSRVVLTGHVYRDGDSLRADAVIIDAATRRIRQALGASAAPLGGTAALIDGVRRRAVAAVMQASDTTLKVDYGILSTPPSLDAYALMRLGLTQILTWDTASIPTLARASRLDSTWVMPRLLLILAAGNNRRFTVAESTLSRTRLLLDRATPAERALLDVHDANYRVDREASLNAAEQLMRVSPGSAEAQLMVVWQAVTAMRVHRALTVTDGMEPDRGVNLGSPFFWRYRTIIFLRLGDARRALDAARAGERAFGPAIFGGLVVQSLAASRRVEETERAIDHYVDDNEKFVNRGVLTETAVMWLWRIGERDAARRIATDGIARLPDTSQARLRLSLLGGGAPATAALLARLRADSVRAGAPKRHDFGTHEYRLARIAMLEGNRDRALRLLADAERKGYPFYDAEGFRPHLDPVFAALNRDPAFERLLEPRDRQ